MRVVVKGNSANDLQVTFFITSDAERVSFHDRAAISLCEGGHKFIGHVYAPSGKTSESVEYEIPIKKPIGCEVQP